ncbi:tRNA-specific adenosine deaminase [Paucilactobacillus hokkaidonensis JCM 18461]|uniref:tRNA-specific adenosine deaminase n=2 Tax=Paucilactobacillus hokkaidonensis TaxID=1193095 RepID=A0A0A1H0L9_9LACO|nr:tRNA adenosine(34) deaminase TadA [Paucilactobacillus hokkaidonensis]KRO10225.1 tRNA-specific adenosine deaminase [Paucilactobacillus hokkaidonensis]BAP86241.1 tRNA-specific adenosine deaminase [Paucilactobacillus hokkaidonensis JCM 18461]
MTLTIEQKKYFMQLALDEAKEADIMAEVPIGAVIVCQGQVIGRGHNMRERFQDVTYHAEMLAISEACATIHSWRLEECQLFVTLEPCIMCSGAILNARIPKVVYGADDSKAGAVKSLYQLFDDQRLNHQVQVECGLMAQQSSQLLKDFFKQVRQRAKQRKNDNKMQ